MDTFSGCWILRFQTFSFSIFGHWLLLVLDCVFAFSSLLLSLFLQTLSLLSLRLYLHRNTLQLLLLILVNNLVDNIHAYFAYSRLRSRPGSLQTQLRIICPLVYLSLLLNLPLVWYNHFFMRHFCILSILSWSLLLYGLFLYNLQLLKIQRRVTRHGSNFMIRNHLSSQLKILNKEASHSIDLRMKFSLFLIRLSDELFGLFPSYHFCPSLNFLKLLQLTTIMKNIVVLIQHWL